MPTNCAHSACKPQRAFYRLHFHRCRLSGVKQHLCYSLPDNLPKATSCAPYTQKPKLRNVDAAIPQNYISDGDVANPFWYVMDYNDEPVFGRLTDLRIRAREKNVPIF